MRKMADVDQHALAKPIIISELLCYLGNKFSKVGVKTLKSIILDFYRQDEISDAKDTLCEATDEIFARRSDLDKWPKPPRRKGQDKDNKARAEVDDLFATFQYLDEKLLLSDLPIFVVKDIDNLPSSKMESGELRCLLNRFDKLESDYLDGLNKITGNLVTLQDDAKLQIAGLNKLDNLLDLSIRKPAPSSLSWNKSADIRPAAWGNSASSAGKVSHARHETMDSDAISATETDDELVQRNNTENNGGLLDTASDGEGFQYPRSRMAKKRIRVNSSPHVMNNSISNENVTNRLIRKNNSIIGTRSNCSMKAAKPLLKKSVFYMGNVSIDETTDSVKTWIESGDVKVLSIFLIKSKFEGTLSFRICIERDHVDKFRNPENWPSSIIIRDWLHKDKPRIVEINSSSNTDLPSNENITA
jgi:hypothetical protein